MTGDFWKGRFSSETGQKGKKSTAPGIPARSPLASTDRARRSFTAAFGREPVFSTWYGRRQEPALARRL